jgi:hypothetical protein
MATKVKPQDIATSNAGTSSQVLQRDGTWVDQTWSWTNWKYKFAIAGTIWATGTNVANTIVVTSSVTLSKCHMWLGTAWDGTLTVDVNKNWTTIFSTTKPAITTTDQYNVDAWVLTTTALVAGDILTLDITAVQATTKWIDLYLELDYS